MKYQFLACSILLVSIFAQADIPKHSAMYYEAIKPEVQEAQRKGAKFKVIYHVVDDDGHPLKNQWNRCCARRSW